MKPKTEAEINSMRAGGQMLAAVLSYLTSRMEPGVTTAELAHLASTKLSDLGGQPAFRGYQGFPDDICISINDEVVHGIPGERQILDGDIVGLDFGVKYQGLITDGAVTVGVGQISPAAQRLLTATQEALEAGIRQVRAGRRVGDISHAVQQRLRQDGLGVVEDLIGHGVGRELHEEPGIPNYGPAGQGIELKAGMTIAIEPMATLGRKDVTMAADGWTIRTADGSLAAQFEHTVLVKEHGSDILTQL